jgi:hypothetical protein
VLVVHCTGHVIKLTFHALCDTVDETTFGFLVPAASYPADQERVWQRHQILHHLSAPLKRKEDGRMARPHQALDKLSLQTIRASLNHVPDVWQRCSYCLSYATHGYHPRLPTIVCTWQCADVPLLTVHATTSPIGQRRDESMGVTTWRIWAGCDCARRVPAVPTASKPARNSSQLA